MPLSEHEQRILEDIERRLEEDDPRLAEAVAEGARAASGAEATSTRRSKLVRSARTRYSVAR